MSEAEILLNDLTETEAKHKHVVPDSDTYFRIDPNTRQIENTSYNKTVLMQGDHNSERFTFELPRYVDGHDMSLCNRVIVHFDNVGVSIENAHHDVAYMTDLRINPENPETVISSWLIRREATQIVGILSFAVQYLCVGDLEDEITYEWKTDSYDEIEIRQSKNNGEAAIINYTNVLEQWRSQLFSAGNSVMTDIESTGDAQVAAIQNESATQRAAIERKGAETLATIPDDYTAVYNMASEAIRTKADGIVCEVKGSAIAINDSSDDYIRGLNVFGKSTQVTTNGYQLFDASILGTVSNGGATITNNRDGSFTVSGSGTLTENIATLKDYTHEESLRMLKVGMLHCQLETTMPYCYIQIRNSSSIYFGLTHSRPSYEITQTILDDEDMFIRIGFYGGAEEEIIPGTVRPMLYQDGDGTWESYSGGYASPSPDYPQEIVSVENPTINVYGKNLLPNKYASDYITHNGITYADAGDGKLSVKGTATANSSFAFASFAANKRTPIPAGTYTVSGNPSEDVYFGFYLYDSQSASEHSQAISRIIKGKSWTFTIDKDSYYGTYVHIPSGNTVDTIISPQLEIGSQATAYEPPRAHQSLSIPDRQIHAIPVTENGNYTDENGQQWICDEVDLERGVLVQRVVEKTLDGMQNYDESGRQVDGTYTGYVNFTDIWIPSGECFVSDKFNCYPEYEYATSPEEGIYSNGGNVARGAIIVRVNNHRGVTDADSLKAWLSDSPITVLCPLKTSKETPLTAEEIAAYKSLKTNYPNTTILNDSGAWMTAKYNADTKQHIDNCIANVAILTSPNGSKFRISVSDDGILTATPV